jgi:hypothetical protein
MFSLPWRRAASLFGIALALALLTSPPLSACSICRCGDPTFNALGSNIYSAGRFSLAFDWDHLSKEQGVFGEELGFSTRALRRAAQEEETEQVVENRFTLTASYSFAERFVVVARLPYSTRTLTEGGEEDHGSGLSDPEFYGLVRLWASNFGPGLGRRAWISAVFGVKTPWGVNDLSEDGVRKDEHVQPGTGSTDLFGGLSGLYLFDEKSALFASSQYRGTGRNDFGYKYGNIVLANLAYERKWTEWLDSALELNFRHSGEDQLDADGTLDPNTGGDILYLTPRLIVDLTHGLVVRASAQIPVWKNLNGIQKERTVFNAGLTYLF